jgi:hypothetical protein
LLECGAGGCHGHALVASSIKDVLEQFVIGERAVESDGLVVKRARRCGITLVQGDPGTQQPGRGEVRVFVAERFQANGGFGDFAAEVEQPGDAEMALRMVGIFGQHAVKTSTSFGQFEPVLVHFPHNHQERDIVRGGGKRGFQGFKFHETRCNQKAGN